MKGIEKIISKITHFIPQHEFVCDKNGEIIVDYVGKFENLNKSVDKINEL